MTKKELWAQTMREFHKQVKKPDHKHIQEVTGLIPPLVRIVIEYVMGAFTSQFKAELFENVHLDQAHTISVLEDGNCLLGFWRKSLHTPILASLFCMNVICGNSDAIRIVGPQTQSSVFCVDTPQPITHHNVSLYGKDPHSMVELQLITTFEIKNWDSQLSSSLCVCFESDFYFIRFKTFESPTITFLSGSLPKKKNYHRLMEIPLWRDPNDEAWNFCDEQYYFETFISHPRPGWLRIGIVNGNNPNRLALMSFQHPQHELKPQPFLLETAATEKKDKKEKEKKSPAANKSKQWSQTAANGYVVYFLHDFAKTPHLLSLRICQEETIECDVVLDLIDHKIYDRDLRIFHVIPFPNTKTLVLVTQRKDTDLHRFISLVCL